MTDPATLPAACAEFRAVLSGYLDGQLEADEIRRADGHLAGCSGCRAVTDETERLERELSTMFDGDDAAPAASADFMGSVMARTVYADGPLRTPGRGTAWLGWVAAAAALTFSAVIWTVDGSRPTRNQASTPGAPGAPSVVAAEFTMSPADAWQVSRTLTVDAGPNDAADAAIDHAPDRAVVGAAAVLLRTLAEAPSDDADALDFARRVVAYDDLLPRLRSLAVAMDGSADAGDHPELLDAIEVIELMSAKPVDGRTLREIQRRIRARDVTDALGRLEQDFDSGRA
ncbi:MAG: zf-HC2 domain-containing protein [Phycisphaerales bacterium]